LRKAANKKSPEIRIFAKTIDVMASIVVPPKSEYEIQRGKPMPSRNHGILQSRLIVYLSNHYSDRCEAISEVSLELNDWEATPDIAIYPKLKIDFWEDEVRMTTPPLGVVEILSPTQALTDLTSKASKYFKSGVQSCWLVIPTFKNIYVFSSVDHFQAFGATEVLKDPVLGLEVNLAEIFK
jgi:Uma2 family endonuclease